MLLIRVSILPFLFTLILISCFEEDTRVDPYPGNVFTIYDSIQTHQSFVDFETGQVQGVHRIDSWELGFECGPDGWHILVNSGTGWFIYNTLQNNLDEIIAMPSDLNGLYDVQSAYPDSTAVGNWVESGQIENYYTNHVYLLGNYQNGSFLNIRQLVFLEVNDTAYSFFYKELSDGFNDTITMSKTDTVNFVYFSFRDRKQVHLEPNKTDYDLVFGYYYDQATQFGLTIPYPVGGTLINVWQTTAYLDSTSGYEYISYENIDDLAFTSQRDIPGYRWKSVSVDVTGEGSATYAVKTYYTYVFRTAQSNYYKLRFLSYTLDGRSGFPRFEYRQLLPAGIVP